MQQYTNKIRRDFLPFLIKSMASERYFYLEKGTRLALKGVCSSPR